MWLKPTDFKNDQILFTSYAPGGASLASEAEYKSAGLATAMVGVGGMGGLNPVDLSKMLSGKIAQASPSIGEYTHGVSGSATPKDLETALQLNYLVHTAPNMTPDVLELLKRRLTGALENRDQNPRAVFGEKVRAGEHLESLQRHGADAGRCAGASTSTRCAGSTTRASRTPPTSRISSSARSRVDEITPLLEKWIGSLPSTGKRPRPRATWACGSRPPVVKEEVKKGKEPASQTVLSFFADPGFDEFEMHRARAAASVLNIRLREILREELGGTYGVGVGFTQHAADEGLRHDGGSSSAARPRTSTSWWPRR